MDLKFGEWLPDLADNENPGSTEAKNVMPSVDGYEPLRELTPVTTALDSECLGAFSAFSNEGFVYNFAGSRTNIYELRGGNWSVRSNSGSFAYEATPGVLQLTGVAATSVIEVDGYLATPGTLRLVGAVATVDLPDVSYEATPGVLRLAPSPLNPEVEITSSGFFLVGNDGEFWEFAKWGDKVIAVGGHRVDPQVITLGDQQFSDLGGSPPKARHIAVVRNFVVMGDLVEGGVTYAQRLRWSGINDETTWTTSQVKQADYQDLRGNHGILQAIRGGEYGIIVMEHGIFIMEYIGPDAVFSIRETMPFVGTPAPHSVVRHGNVCFMLGQDGFVGLEHGRRTLDIGSNKIDRWFFDNVETDYIVRTVGAWDRVRGKVFWIFPVHGSNNGRPNHGLVFDLDSGRWSHFEDEVEWIFTALGQSLTLEELDSISSSLDLLPASLDSRLYTSNDLELMGFGEAHTSGAFDGTAMAATIDTTEAQVIPGRRAMVSRVRLEVDEPAAATVRSGTRASQADSVAWSGDFAAAGDGSYPMRRESRYHRFRASITGGFTKAQGVTIEEAAATGRR